MTEAGASPQATSGGKALGWSVPAGILLLFALRYGNRMLSYLFDPSSQELPHGVEVQLLSGKYEAGGYRTSSGGIQPFADVSFTIVVRNTACTACDIRLVTVDVSERVGSGTFAHFQSPTRDGRLPIGDEIAVDVAVHSPPAVALRKFVLVRLLERPSESGNVGVGKRLIAIPGLTNVEQIWGQTAFTEGRAVVPIPDR